MKTVEDAVRELGGDWRKAIEPGGDYLWAIGGLWQALNGPTGFSGEFICTREEFDECKTKLEGKSMKLIDILARDLEWWPKSFGYAAQDRRRMGHIKPVLWAYRRPPVRSDEYNGWEDDPVSVGHKLLGHVDLAEDHATAIITREQWEEARRELRAHESLACTGANPGLASSVMSPTIDDPVNSPRHYTLGGIECIDAIEAQLTPEEFRGFCKGNAAKYIWRERHKGGSQSLQKAAWYLGKLKEEE